MIESKPATTTEVSKNSNQAIIDSVKRSGYDREFPEKKDHWSELHFTRHLNPGRTYPHFHLIYNPDKDKLDLHLDIRRHKASRRNTNLSQEAERLFHCFAFYSIDSPSESDKSVLSDLSKRFLALAMFETAEWYQGQDKHKSRYLLQKGIKAKKRKKIRDINKKKYLSNKYQVVPSSIAEYWESAEE